MVVISQQAWGYIVSIAGFAAFAGCLSPSNSYGRIFTAIQQDLNTTAVQTGWIGSMAWCGCYLTSPLAVILVRFAGYRRTAVVSAVIVSGSYLGTSFMEGYIGILVFYGVLMGGMSGIIVHIAFSVILTTFNPTHRIRGTSIVSCGSSFGTIFVTMAYEKLVLSLGWRKCLQITSIYCAVLAIPAAFFLAPREPAPVLKRKTSNINVTADETATSVYSISSKVEGTFPGAYMPDIIDQPKSKRWLRLLFMWRTWLLFFGIFFPAMSWSVYWVNIISFYESIFVSADDIFLYVTIQTFSDLAGKVFFILFGTCLTNIPALMIVSNLALALTTVVLAVMPVKTVLLISSVFIGVGRGWFNIHPITASVDLLQVPNSEQSVTVSMVALGCGFLLGTLPAGMIYDATGSYSFAFFLNALFYLIGAAFFIVLMVLKKAKKKRKISQRLSMTGIANNGWIEEN